MHTKKKIMGAAAAVVILLGLAAGCGGSGKASTGRVEGAQKTSSRTLNGAGSTFVAPLVDTWVARVKSALGVTLNYSAIGSGGGISAITGRTVDFGASDAPLTAAQAKACHGCVQIPWALGGTAIFFNLPGVHAKLHLDGATLAKIYLGQIKAWNDPAIESLNSGVQLPSTPITVVHRSDGSGTTFNLTDFLSHVSGTWKEQVGDGTAVSWPTGVGAPHSSGVAAAVKETPGGIGYAEAAYARANRLRYFSIRNRAGKYVAPTTAATAAAAEKARFGPDNSVSIVDPSASIKNAYPISTFTYVVVPQSSAKVRSLKRFIDFAITVGQRRAAKLDFSPLPKNVVTRDEAVIKRL